MLPYNAQNNDVTNVAIPVQQMRKYWKLVDNIREGTQAMRRVPEYLPQNPRESNQHYENRKSRSFLFDLYTRTLVSITGLAFTKPVVVSNAPAELRYLEHDFDGTGRTLTECAYDLTINALNYGVAYALVDFPPVEDRNMSLAEWRESKYRPYVSIIQPPHTLGWRVEEKRNSAPYVTQFRFSESRIVASGESEFVDKLQHVISVYEPDRIRIFTSDTELDGGSFTETATLENTLGYVPLVTAYGNKIGYMTGKPAMYSLAELNLRHFQSSSEQANILHFARVPFLFAYGFNEGDLENTEIGASMMIVSSNPDARINHVEHSGQAIGSGRQDLKDLELQMAMLGADMLVSKGVGRMTATARRLDQSESMSVLQMALRSVERAIEQMFYIAADWMEIDVVGDISVKIGEDMSVANEPNPAAALKVLMSTGLLTDEQVVEEAKRQGILSSYFKLNDARPKNVVTTDGAQSIDFSAIPVPENIEEAPSEAPTATQDASSIDSLGNMPDALTEAQNGSQRKNEDGDEKKQDMIERLLQYIMK